MMLKGCAIALIAAFCAVMLKELGFRSAGVFGAVCGAVMLSLSADVLSAGAAQIKEIAALSDIADIASDILKIVGIGYIFGFCSDICTDLGEGTTASALTVLGRLEVVGIALPYFKKIIDLGLSLIK